MKPCSSISSCSWCCEFHAHEDNRLWESQAATLERVRAAAMSQKPFREALGDVLAALGPAPAQAELESDGTYWRRSSIDEGMAKLRAEKALRVSGARCAELEEQLAIITQCNADLGKEMEKHRGPREHAIDPKKMNFAYTGEPADTAQAAQAEPDMVPAHDRNWETEK